MTERSRLSGKVEAPTYTCEMCGNTYEMVIPDEEAQAEGRREDTTAVFECQCHTHELHAARDQDWGVEFAFWRYGDGWAPWTYRLRHIWRIIRHGKPYSDYVVLSFEDARRLGAWLSAAENA